MTRLEQEQRNLIDSIELGVMLGKSRDNVLRMCRQGKLPKPVKPVPTNKRWLAGDIETWLSLGRPSQEKFECYKGKSMLDDEFFKD